MQTSEGGTAAVKGLVLGPPDLWILAVLDNPCPYYRATLSGVFSNLQPKAPNFWSPQLSVRASLWHSAFCTVISLVLKHFPISEFLHLLFQLPGNPSPKSLTRPALPCHLFLISKATFSMRPSLLTHHGLVPAVRFYHIAHCGFSISLTLSMICLSFPTGVSAPQATSRSAVPPASTTPHGITKEQVLYLILALVPSRRASGSLLRHPK